MHFCDKLDLGKLKLNEPTGWLAVLYRCCNKALEEPW